MDKPRTKRLRIFAGPNGSGKTTLAKAVKDKRINLGIFINADEIESELREKGYFPLDAFCLESDSNTLRAFIQENGMTSRKLGIPDIHLSFSISENRIYFSGTYSSYIAADIASFARHQLMLKGSTFSFETVFSHESKLRFMEEAKRHGYRVYLYFLATEDPEINVNRVDVRVAEKGHPVSRERIVERYYRSLNLLLDAAKRSDRAYLFDNSYMIRAMVAEITDGKEVRMSMDTARIPNWFIEYVVRRNQKPSA